MRVGDAILSSFLNVHAISELNIFFFFISPEVMHTHTYCVYVALETTERNASRRFEPLSASRE